MSFYFLLRCFPSFPIAKEFRICSNSWKDFKDKKLFFSLPTTAFSQILTRIAFYCGKGAQEWRWIFLFLKSRALLLKRKANSLLPDPAWGHSLIKSMQEHKQPVTSAEQFHTPAFYPSKGHLKLNSAAPAGPLQYTSTPLRLSLATATPRQLQKFCLFSAQDLVSPPPHTFSRTCL